mmetsp:Transcript_3866/g.8513  ORF Transcript_3866/g.8513 Transcript_3866/m.8513 type:complete len:144 (-) Transcript_3866:734-1165(-)
MQTQNSEYGLRKVTSPYVTDSSFHGEWKKQSPKGGVSVYSGLGVVRNKGMVRHEQRMLVGSKYQWKGVHQAVNGINVRVAVGTKLHYSNGFNWCIKTSISYCPGRCIILNQIKGEAPRPRNDLTRIADFGPHETVVVENTEIP